VPLGGSPRASVRRPSPWPTGWERPAHLAGRQRQRVPTPSRYTWPGHRPVGYRQPTPATPPSHQRGCLSGYAKDVDRVVLFEPAGPDDGRGLKWGGSHWRWTSSQSHSSPGSTRLSTRSYWQRAKVAPLVDENPYRAVMMGGASQSAGSSPAAAMSLCAAGAAPAFCRASAS
jgi:hypothetical protein